MSEMSIPVKMKVLGVVKYPQDDRHKCDICKWGVVTLFRVQDKDGDVQHLCAECFAETVLDLPSLSPDEDEE